MPLYKNDYPILEYDTEKTAIIDPKGEPNIPAKCLMTFFDEVLQDFVKKHNAVEVNSYISEMKDFPIYKAIYKGVEIGLTQATVGSGSSAMQADHIIGHGVKTLIACGSCGVLTDIPAGDVIIPTSALRDEGASYHYLPPAREIALDGKVIASIKKTLDELAAPYVEAKTWTTDAFFRETPSMVAYRKQEGCAVVEMECATLAAVSEFRRIKFGQLLYSGDTLADPEKYDGRDFYNNLSARERLFYLALEALVGV